jgi:hypothetical protein
LQSLHVVPYVYTTADFAIFLRNSRSTTC